MVMVIVAVTVIIGICRRVRVYEAFVDGAREGMQTAVQIFPGLAVTFMALQFVQSSGLLTAVEERIAPMIAYIGLPEGVAPLMLVRPLSGSASLGVLSQIMQRYGADSRTGLVACTMMGSGETVLYLCTVYLAAAGVKKSRYVIPASLAGWLAGCITAGMLFR